MSRRIIFLYGAPASGKTTLGRRLAKSLGWKALDLDAEIEEREGVAISEIFATRGEGVFRDIETEVLAQTICEADGNTIVSLGGGTLLKEANREMCETAGEVLCLEAPDSEELARRIGDAAGVRPLGNKAEERAAHYASFPCRIAAGLEAGEGDMESFVLIGTGIAKALVGGMHIVADRTVAGLYSDLSPMTTIPSGEEHKTPETILNLWHEFAKAGLGRRDRVVALGGGVTGDLTGFAAATWMRGIDWINVPTTLLAMVDASTGGKTGCDLEEGKNLAGAFHAPRLVVIDTKFLGTLPEDILADGKAEMIKHLAIGGKAPSEKWICGVPDAKDIAANLAVKVGIVRTDPYERLGKRLLLNAGHTVAHALEKSSNYSISHGSAVAIGCVEEAKLAARFGMTNTAWPEEFASAFRKAGLPTTMPEGVTIEALAPLMAGDKKKSSGSVVKFALPCGWGDTRAVDVDLSEGLRQC